MDWIWTPGKYRIIRTLYGLINGKKQVIFWEFRPYWNFDKNQGILAQYGADGRYGIEPLSNDSVNHNKLVQTFINTKGEKVNTGIVPP